MRKKGKCAQAISAVSGGALAAALITMTSPAAAVNFEEPVQAGTTRWDLPVRNFTRHAALFGGSAYSRTLASQNSVIINTNALSQWPAPVSFAPVTGLPRLPATFSPQSAMSDPLPAPSIGAELSIDLASATWSDGIGERLAIAGTPELLASQTPAGSVRQASYMLPEVPLTPPIAEYRRKAAPVEQAAPRISESGGPNVFGSVAVAIQRTPLDGQWRRASRSASVRPAGWSQIRTAATSESELEQLDVVNRWVNHRIEFASDRIAIGTSDRWAGAAELINRGVGDCEDFALAKLQLLQQLGFDERDLYLVVVRDLVRRADHAVLVVRVGDQLLMLDNNTDRILDASLQMDYRPVFSYSSQGRWVHGYTQTPEPAVPVRLASALPAAGGR